MIPLLITLAVLFLLSLLPLGVRVLYREGGFFLSVKVGPFLVQVFPVNQKKKEKREKKQEKKPKKAKKKENKPKEEAPAKPKKGGALALIKAYLPLVRPTLSKIRRRLTIDDVELQVTWAASDPASAALGFGYASAALEILWNVIASNFKVRKNQLGCDVDFDAQEPTVYLDASIEMTLGRMITLVVPLLIRILVIYIRVTKKTPESTKKEA